MREIKFRAWNKRVKQMHGPYSWWELDKPVPALGSPDDEWMQYTGLKDNNGEEIYEGDIFKDWRGQIGIIEWHNHWPEFCLHIKRKRFRFNLGEVIGNIYKNPELISGKAASA